jgi:hypothetical protein
MILPHKVERGRKGRDDASQGEIINNAKEKEIK